MPFDTATPAPLTAESVLATFAAVDANCTHDDADDIARRVNGHTGDVMAALRWSQHAFAYDAESRLTRYIGAVEEAADPRKLKDRLLRDVANLELAAENARKSADEFRRKAETWADAEYHGFAERAASFERLAIRYLKDARLKQRLANALDDTPEPPPAAKMKVAA